VNYALEVRGLWSNGYHEISTIMQSISLADQVEIERVERGFELVVEPEGVGIGPPEENTLYRAWVWMGELIGEELPVRIRLRKQIPVEAGLGGGSADAAAALVGLNVLFGSRLSDAQLRRGGLRIGADVPFCLTGGTALGEGIGEVLSPLPAPPPHHLVVAKPDAGAQTARIYHIYDEERSRGAHPSVAPVAEALHAGDLGALARALDNDLAPVTKSLVPEVRVLEGELQASGSLGAAMSGTGTAVYGLFGSEAEARASADGLQAPFVSLCKPVARGVEVL